MRTNQSWLTFRFLNAWNLLRDRPAMFRPGLVPKFFEDFPLYRIFGHIYEALNVDEKN
jgi:hypothetical protein